MSEFTSPTAAFDHLLLVAQHGRLYTIDEVFDAARNEDPNAQVGTGLDLTEHLMLPGRDGNIPVETEAALRLIAVDSNFRRITGNTACRLFARTRLSAPDSACIPTSRYPRGERLSYASYMLTHDDVAAVMAGEQPSYACETKWGQGSSFSDSLFDSTGVGTYHKQFVNTAKAVLPNMLTMLSETTTGTFYPRELVQLAGYVSARHEEQ
ncbi:MAG TPA: hypothetical protein VLH84_05230 [Patescibacteria group bacterium]|nr:hypothetical protein [Patescibacteria group bacterium]